MDQFIKDSADRELFAALIAKSHWALLEREAGIGELHSWRNSLQSLRKILISANLHDQLVFLEYCIPSQRKFPHRVDAIIAGYDIAGNLNAVMLEFKQWGKCTLRKSLFSKTLIMKYNGKKLKQSHPSTQVKIYRNKMCKILKVAGLPINFITFIAFAFLPDCKPDTKQKRALYHSVFARDYNDAKIYTGDFAFALVHRLKEFVGERGGEDVFRSFHTLQTKAVENILKLEQWKPSILQRIKYIYRFWKRTRRASRVRFS